jgi:hypothetical protein
MYSLKILWKVENPVIISSNILLHVCIFIILSSQVTAVLYIILPSLIPVY